VAFGIPPELTLMNFCSVPILLNVYALRRGIDRAISAANQSGEFR